VHDLGPHQRPLALSFVPILIVGRRPAGLRIVGLCKPGDLAAQGPATIADLDHGFARDEQDAIDKSMKSLEFAKQIGSGFR
jgi:hypothetical protein